MCNSMGKLYWRGNCIFCSFSQIRIENFTYAKFSQIEEKSFFRENKLSRMSSLLEFFAGINFRKLDQNSRKFPTAKVSSFKGDVLSLEY